MSNADANPTRWRGPWFLVVAAAVAWFAPLFALPVERLVDDWAAAPIADDAFYFLQIARHLAAGTGSTFDGVHATDGYQPLWLWCLAGMQWLGGCTPQGLLQAALLLAIALLLATALQLVAFLRAAGVDRRLAALAAVAAAAWPPLVGCHLTLCEAPLNGFLYVTCLRAVVPVVNGAVSRARLGALGLLFGLLFLARLDNFLWIGAMACAIAVRRGVAAGARDLLWVAAVLGPIGLGYVTGNVLRFGHVMPISGAVKSLRSAPIAAGDPVFWVETIRYRMLWFLGREGGIARALTALLVLVAAAPGRLVLASRPRWQLDGHAFVLWCSVLSFVPKHLYYAVAQGDFNEATWYYTTELWTLVLCVGAFTRSRAGWVAAVVVAAALVWAGWPADALGRIANLQLPYWAWLPAATLLAVALLLAASLRIEGASRRGPCLAAGLALLAFMSGLPGRAQLFGQQPYATEKGRLLQLGRWARDVRLAEHGTMGAYSAGLVGYFQGGAVTNLDGLVADWEWYAMAAANGRFPPPRSERFVLDYHPITRERLLATGYRLCLDELPDYVPGAQNRRGVFVVTNDLAAAQRVYLDVLARADAERVLRTHAAGVAFRLQLPQVLAALAGESLAAPAPGAETTAQFAAGGAMLFAEYRGGGAACVLRVTVDDAVVAELPGNDGRSSQRIAVDLGTGSGPAAASRTLRITALASTAGGAPLQVASLCLVPVP